MKEATRKASCSATLHAIDLFCQSEINDIDAFIAKHGLDEPEEEVVPVDWQPPPEPPEQGECRQRAA